MAYFFDDGTLDCAPAVMSLQNDGWKVLCFSSITDLLSALNQQSVDCIFLSLSGVAPSAGKLITRIKEAPFTNRTSIIVLGDRTSRELGERCVSAGADNFCEFNTDFIKFAEAAVRARTEASQPSSLSSALVMTPLTGDSESVKNLREQIGRVARSDAPVFLWGESGTGKEVVARLVHSSSERANGPLVVRSCASFHLDLFEADMFGYVKGAFTGANRDTNGVFGAAAGGTLVLDEISELPPPLQAKLLRVLQEGRYCRVGEQSEIKSDIRLVVTTNVNPSSLLAEQRLREDFHFRVSTLQVRLPRLTDRKGDIPSLTKFFLGPEICISDEVYRVLQAYPWPGNIRELQNECERLRVLGKREVELADLSDNLRLSRRGGSLSSQLLEVEKLAIKDALVKVNGNRTRAAKILGISRPNLLAKLKRLNLSD